MKEVNKFYRWFTVRGGNVAHFEASAIYDTLNKPDFLVSSLKNRAQEIKEKYNYQFKN